MTAPAQLGKATVKRYKTSAKNEVGSLSTLGLSSGLGSQASMFF